MVLEYHQTYAEIIEDYNIPEIKIAIAGESCRDLMTVIMRELDIIHDIYKTLTYDILIPCKYCDSLEFEYNILQRYAKKIKPIECRKCEQENDAQFLINGIYNPHISGNKNKNKGNGKNALTINIHQGDKDMSEDKSIHVSGSAKIGNLSTGKHTSNTYNETHNTQNQGIQADLKSLSELLLKLDLGEDQKKVEKLLTTAETEMKADTPDKEEIGNSLDRVLRIVKKTGQLSDEIIPFGQKIGEFLGEYGGSVLEFVGQIPT